MKIVKIITFLAFAFVIGTFLCSNTQKTEFSEKALKEQITSIDANQISFQEVLNQYKGKPIVMEVWASWCGDCVKAMPQMKELQATKS
jgi:thioredoxin-like negative regulator of GroEL